MKNSLNIYSLRTFGALKVDDRFACICCRKDMYMKRPKMILFDYGQTLANERSFDGIKGTEAVLSHAVKNKYGRTAYDVQSLADELNNEMGRYDPARKHLFQIEVPNAMFNAYLYGSLGIEIDLSPTEFDRIFWDAAAPAVPTEGVEDFLACLREEGIRTGVISNIAYSGEAVEERIRALLPEHDFEFILATSEYMFRKPHRRIFELALEKAGLDAEDVWYIGDSYECDVAGAENAGLFPVWYVGASKHHERKEDILTIKHWDELRRMLTELN